MKIKVTIYGKETKEIELKKDKVKIEDLLKELGFLPVEVVVVKNNEIVPEDDYVCDGDELVIYPIILL